MPSAALRRPGVISRCTRRATPESATPNSSAPMEPWSSIISAPTTIRKSPPKMIPKASSGTLARRSNWLMARGRSFADSTQATTVKIPMWASRLRMPARFGPWSRSPSREPDEQQGDQLGDDDRGEDFEPDGFLEVPAVRKHLGHESEAGERQDAREREGVHEVEAEREADREEVGGDEQGAGHGNAHGHERRHEEPAPDRGLEARQVNLVEAHQEEEQEDPDVQEDVQFVDLDVRVQPHDPGDGAEQDAGGGVGDDGVQPVAAQQRFGELGRDDEQSQGQQRFDHERSPAGRMPRLVKLRTPISIAGSAGAGPCAAGAGCRRRGVPGSPPHRGT